jgi:glutathione S-transferase
MLKLHVFPPSPRAVKVMALANHLGLEHEIVLVDLFQGGNATPEYGALNPNRKMPVLEDGDFVLWESNAILQYLASRRPESGLWPSEPRRQADVSRWQFWDCAHWDPTCATFVFERVVKRLANLGEEDPAQIAKGEKELARFGAVLNESLAGRRWVTGDALTVADFSLGAGLVYARPAGIPLDRYPEIARWYDALSALPGWKDVLPPMPG